MKTLTHENATIYVGNNLKVLPRLPKNSIHICCTSPPYWNQRDYNTGTWEGGSAECDHKPDDKWLYNQFNAASGLTRSGSISSTQNASAATRWYEKDGSCPKCGAKRIDEQLGNEELHDCFGYATGRPCNQCYVCHLVQVFRLVRRCLRPDGLLFLNLGDTYSSTGGKGQNRHWDGREKNLETQSHRVTPDQTGLASKNLVGIPWRVALALQADGWILRSGMPWINRCLSGGTWLYTRTQKGDMPMMLKDLVRLRPDTVQLWNGDRWTRVIGFHRVEAERPDKQQRGRNRHKARKDGLDRTPSDYYELEFRSGERVGATAEHQWPVTNKGNVRTDCLSVGDIVQTITLPERKKPKRPAALDDQKIGWFVGLFLAEGHIDNETITISGHVKETEGRLESLAPLVKSFDGTFSVRQTQGTNSGYIIIRCFPLLGVLRQYVYGDCAKNKKLTSKVWNRTNVFLDAILHGYLEGDGHWEVIANRWRLGFCNNDGLATDIRTLCARLNYRCRLRRGVACAKSFGPFNKIWRGEIRMTPPGANTPPGGFKTTDNGEIVAIRNSRARNYWDIEVADEPNFFALASGILTHNSKMPESCTDRPASGLEYVFLFAKTADAYFDMEAVKAKAATNPHAPGNKKTFEAGGHACRESQVDKIWGSESGRNFRNSDLWLQSLQPPHGLVGMDDELLGLDVVSEGSSLKHFALFPTNLIRPLILAGTSHKGCCPTCGAPWKRIIERQRKATRTGRGSKVTAELKKRKDAAEDVPGNPMYRRGSHNSGLAVMAIGNRDPQRHVTDIRTLGWSPTCECYNTPVMPDQLSAPGQRKDQSDADYEIELARHRKIIKRWRRQWDELKPIYDKLDTIPASVLDPFSGLATTGLVCQRLGRRYTGIELSAEYATVSIKRLKQRGKVGREPKKNKDQRGFGVFNK